MSKWSSRSSLYRFTFVCLVFLFLTFLLAAAVPQWFGSKSTHSVAVGGATVQVTQPYYKGLWLTCTKVVDDVDFDNCTVVAFGDDNLDWMDGVRGVWVAGAAFYSLAILIAIGDNCCCDCGNKDYGMTAMWMLIAGLDGAAGVIVVAVKTADDDSMNDYRWGFYLACVSSGLTIILSIMLCISRHPTRGSEKTQRSRTADYVYNSGPNSGVKNGGPQQNGGFTNHRDDIPMSNGYHGPGQTQNAYSMYRGGPQQAEPSAPYHGQSLQRPRVQPQGGPGYSPYGNGNGYDMSRPNQRASMAESADLSNGYTTDLIQAEHSLSRSNRPAYGGQGQGGQDYYHNGRY